MTTAVLEADISTDPVVRLEMKKQKQQSHRAFVYDVITCLTLLAYFSGMFFAIKLCLEIGLQAVVHAIADHVRLPVGF